MNALATDPDTRTRTHLPSQVSRSIAVLGNLSANRTNLDERHCLYGKGYAGKQSESIELFGLSLDCGDPLYLIKAEFSAVKDWTIDLTFDRQASSLPELCLAVCEIKESVETVLLKLGVPEYGGHLHISINTTSLSNYKVLSDVVEAATKAVLNAFE